MNTAAMPTAFNAPVSRFDWYLLQAAANGQASLVAQALADGAGIEARDPDGDNALNLATRLKRVDAIEALVAAGADLNSVDREGWTPLARAAFGGDAGILALLLDAGADMGATVLHGIDLLHLAAASDSDPCVKLLVERGLRANGPRNRDAPSYTAAMQAINHGNAKILHMLVEAGADVDFQWPDGTSASHMAAAKGRADCLRVLICAGADVQRPDNAGATPAMLAARLGRLDGLALLAQAGADLRARDAKGRSALDYAIAAHRCEAATMLSAWMEAAVISAATPTPAPSALGSKRRPL